MASEVLRDPEKHFARAVELAARSAAFAIHAKEVAIQSKFVAAELMKESLAARHYAIWHVAQGLAAMALQKKFTAS
jgi:hypothetical protein